MKVEARRNLAKDTVECTRKGEYLYKGKIKKFLKSQNVLKIWL